MSKQKRTWDVILVVVMVLLCLLWIYPIVLILLNSLKTGQNGRDVGKRSAEQPANDWPNRQTKR